MAAIRKRKTSLQLLRPLASDPSRHFWREGDSELNCAPLCTAQVMAQGTVSEKCVSRLREHLTRGGRLEQEAALLLISLARARFAAEPNLLHLPSPICMFGDTHGQFYDALNVFDSLGLPSAGKKMLLLGDYVDRGMFSTEIVLYLCACKVCYPDSVFLLRGNHESRVMSSAMSFRKECIYKYSEIVYEAFQTLFDALPLAAVVSGTPYGSIFCVHGGIGPGLKTLADIDAIDRFCEIPDEGLMTDLVWSDPVAPWDPENPDFAYTSRGEWLDLTYAPNSYRHVSCVYGMRAVRTFLETNKLAFIVRGHQVQKSGFERHFTYLSEIPRVMTLFGCPNYCDLYGNVAAFMQVSDSIIGVQQYPQVPHPCVLPDFTDVFSFSIPFMMQQITGILKFLCHEDATDDDHVSLKDCKPVQRGNGVDAQRPRRRSSVEPTKRACTFETLLDHDRENEAMPPCAVRPISLPMRRVHSMPDLCMRHAEPPQLLYASSS